MAIPQVTDEEAQLKRQSRRRLIGAVALTTAVAVILPMVLDGEPKPAGVNIELVVPDKNHVPAFQPNPPVAQAQLPVPASAVVESVPASAVPAIAVPVKPLTPPSSATTAKPVAPMPSPAAPAQSATPPAKATDSVAAPESSKTPESEKVSGTAPAKADMTETPAKQESHAKSEPTKSGGSFYLQVGVFSNADNARDLAAKLKKQGFSVSSERMDTRTRIRVGPYSSREAADKARHKLEAQGMKPALVDTGRRG